MKLHSRPLFIITVFYLLGIIFASFHLHPLLTALFVCVIIFAGFCAFRKKIPLTIIITALTVFIAAFLRTMAFQLVPASDVSRLAEGKLVYLTGIIVSDPEFASGRQKFTVRVQSVRTYTGEYSASGYTAVTLYRNVYDIKSPEPVPPSFGELVKIHGRLKLPAPPTNPGQYDYGRYLARKQIYCTLTSDLRSFARLKLPAFSIRLMALRIRSALAARANEYLPPVQAMLLLGILLGSYSSLPYDVQSAFMKSGTMHILAASGYNCGIIIIIFKFLMQRMTISRSTMNIILIILIWIFAFICGFGPSIVRASIMITLALSAYILWRVTDLINVVLCSAFIIMAIDPLSIFDVGFQLSFGALSSIILILPLLEDTISFNGLSDRYHGRIVTAGIKILKFFAETIAVTSAALIGTWPITASYFNYISIISVISNAFAAILIMPITILGIATFIIGYIIPPAGYYIALITGMLINVLLWIISYTGNYQWASISVHSPSPLFILTYYLIILAILEYAYRKANDAKNSIGSIAPGNHITDGAVPVSKQP